MVTVNSNQILEELNSHITGLYYPDENGFPVRAEVLPAEKDLVYTLFLKSAYKGEVKLKEENAQAFFAKITSTACPENRTVRFNVLKSFLFTNLSDLKVFRLGETKQDIYVTGVTDSGDHVVLYTRELSKVPYHYISDY